MKPLLLMQSWSEVVPKRLNRKGIVTLAEPSSSKSSGVPEPEISVNWKPSTCGKYHGSTSVASQFAVMVCELVAVISLLNWRVPPGCNGSNSSRPSPVVNTHVSLQPSLLKLSRSQW